MKIVLSEAYNGTKLSLQYDAENIKLSLLLTQLLSQENELNLSALDHESGVQFLINGFASFSSKMPFILEPRLINLCCIDGIEYSNVEVEGVVYGEFRIDGDVVMRVSIMEVGDDSTVQLAAVLDIVHENDPTVIERACAFNDLKYAVENFGADHYLFTAVSNTIFPELTDCENFDTCPRVEHYVKEARLDYLKGSRIKDHTLIEDYALAAVTRRIACVDNGFMVATHSAASSDWVKYTISIEELRQLNADL